MPAAQLASRLTPRGWLIAGGVRGRGDPVRLPLPARRLQAELHDAGQRRDPSQTGKMTSTLSAQGISYQLQNNGTAIAVQANETSKARVALAGANLLGNTQPGFSLFEKQNLGESNFQQQVTYQRALQGQLAETIDSVQGVSGRAGRARAAELPEPDLRRKPSGTSAAPCCCRGRPRSAPSCGARDRAAGLLERPRAAAEQGHDHRRLRSSCCGRSRRRRRRRGRRQRAGSRAAATTRTWPRASTRCSPRRSASASRRCSCTRT